jgi:hypothetical protein
LAREMTILLGKKKTFIRNERKLNRITCVRVYDETLTLGIVFPVTHEGMPILMLFYFTFFYFQ